MHILKCKEQAPIHLSYYACYLCAINMLKLVNDMMANAGMNCVLPVTKYYNSKTFVSLFPNYLNMSIVTRITSYNSFTFYNVWF